MYHVEKNFNFKNRTKLWASIKLIDSRFLLLPWRKMMIHTQFGKGCTLPKTPQGITPLSPIKQSPLPAFSGYIYLEIRTNHVMFNTLFSFLGHSACECSRYLILRSPMLLRIMINWKNMTQKENVFSIIPEKVNSLHGCHLT